MGKAQDKKTPPIDLSLLGYAIDASSCAISIADARKEDMPLIYVNETFKRITGYESAEVLGRNCRFLQGRQRKQAGLEKIRKAIKKHEPCTVTLENFRKDGTPFWNELHLAPVFDARENSPTMSAFKPIFPSVSLLSMNLRSTKRIWKIWSKNARENSKRKMSPFRKS